MEAKKIIYIENMLIKQTEEMELIYKPAFNPLKIIISVFKHTFLHNRGMN